MADYEGQMAGQYSTPQDCTVRRIGVNFHLNRETRVFMFGKADFLENRGNPNPTRLDRFALVPGDNRLESGRGGKKFSLIVRLHWANH